MPPVTPPLDVSAEELEALLEGVREALGERGYQKLKAAIRTLSYVTELLENREATLAESAPTAVPCAQREDRGGAGTGRHRPSRLQGHRQPTQARRSPLLATGATARRRIAVRSVSKCRMPSLHRGDRCPECQRGKVYPLQEPGRAGAVCEARRRSPPPCTNWRSCAATLCGEVFTAEARRSGRREVRHDGGQHDRAAPLRQRVSLESPG